MDTIAIGKNLLTKEEISVRWGISVAAFNKYLENGILKPTVRVGKRALFSADMKKPIDHRRKKEAVC